MGTQEQIHCILATVGILGSLLNNTFLCCAVRNVSLVPVIWAEVCFVYIHQLFVDAPRELHRVEQGWLYSFSHLRRAPEEIRFCLLWIPVYWQQHLLWIFCKAFYMMNPTIQRKISIQKRTPNSAFSSFYIALDGRSLAGLTPRWMHITEMIWSDGTQMRKAAWFCPCGWIGWGPESWGVPSTGLCSAV